MALWWNSERLYQSRSYDISLIDLVSAVAYVDSINALRHVPLRRMGWDSPYIRLQRVAIVTYPLQSCLLINKPTDNWSMPMPACLKKDDGIFNGNKELISSILSQGGRWHLKNEQKEKKGEMETSKKRYAWQLR